MFRCIDNMIPLNRSASCPATQKNEAKRGGGEMMEPKVLPPCVPHPAACALLPFCLLSNCTGSLTALRGRPLCITLRWMTKCRATKVSVLLFTPWGWLRRWTPAVTVPQPLCVYTLRKGMTLPFFLIFITLIRFGSCLLQNLCFCQWLVMHSKMQRVWFSGQRQTKRRSALKNSTKVQ